jgi:HEAT repeat protein
MRRTYGASLVAALRQGITEVFTASASPFQAVRRDSQAVRIAVRGLDDHRPSIRILSLTLLGELDAEEAVETIASLHVDSVPEVREAAVEALGRISSGPGQEAAAAFLSDADDRVRAAAVDAAHVDLAALQSLTGDPSPRVRARAAVGLARAGQRERAQAVLDSLLADPSVEARLMGLRACSEVDGAAAPAKLIEALRDGPRAVRVEAASVA